MANPTHDTLLVADIGGTNARFARIGDGGRLEHVRVLAVEDHPSLEHAARAYLSQCGLPRARRAALAVATPVTDDAVRFTNSPWSFSCRELRSALDLERLVVLNDFTALALALPHLEAGELEPVGGGHAVPGCAIGLIGPGTGLGVSGLVPARRGWVPLASEGGHVTLPGTTARERAVLEMFGEWYGHVSAERVVSGSGLVALYRALGTLDGGPAASLTPAEISARGCDGSDPRAVETLHLFCAFLGIAAGNLALTLGARGGIYIGGGIVPHFADRLAETPFRARFEAKGRFAGYLQAVPTFVITAPYPGLTGAAAALADDVEAGIRVGRA